MKYSKYSGITLLESWCVLIEHLDVVALEVLLYNRLSVIKYILVRNCFIVFLDKSV